MAGIVSAGISSSVPITGVQANASASTTSSYFGVFIAANEGADQFTGHAWGGNQIHRARVDMTMGSANSTIKTGRVNLHMDTPTLLPG
jgi:hypothetical protein